MQGKDNRVAERKTCQLRVLHSVQISVKNYGKTKTFSNKQQLIEITDSRPALQDMLTESLGQKECLTVTPQRWES